MLIFIVYFFIHNQWLKYWLLHSILAPQQQQMPQFAHLMCSKTSPGSPHHMPPDGTYAYLTYQHQTSLEDQGIDVQVNNTIPFWNWMHTGFGGHWNNLCKLDKISNPFHSIWMLPFLTVPRSVQSRLWKWFFHHRFNSFLWWLSQLHHFLGLWQGLYYHPLPPTQVR